MIVVNGIEITAATIEKTQDHFADIYRACIKGAENGTLGLAAHVDVARYIGQQEMAIQRVIMGGSDHTLTFAQRAYWIQTGESLALLA